MVTFALRLGLWICAAALLLGLLGRVHGVFDAFAVGRLWLGVALVPLILIGLTRRLWASTALGGVALALIAPSLWPYLSAPTPSPPSRPWITGYQHNILFDNSRQDEIYAQILARDPDFVALQEVSGLSAGLRDRLRTRYPHVLHCHLNYGWAAVLLTRLAPTGAQGCHDSGRVSYMQVETPGGPALTLVSLHLGWPWPNDQRGFVRDLQPLLGQIPRPMVVAGDFNQQPWSVTVQTLAQATGTTPVPGGRWTFWLGGVLPLQIDNVLAEPGLGAHVQKLGRYGSDHNAQWITLARP
ncbi:MAG: endonuclease/exonuclease/phosphatase family protein [Pseudomonadota bacterium]